MTANVDRPILLYDGSCPMCRSAKAWIEAHAATGTLTYVPCQSPEREATGISFETCMSAMQLVLPDGRVFAGEQAFPCLLRMTRHWWWLAAVLKAPGIRQISPAAYKWVARHRMALSGFFKPCGENTQCGVEEKP